MNVQNSLVAVCIPTYEPDPAHLRAAIESVLSQTEQRFHIFICDDASSIDVQSFVESYTKDPRITFVRSNHRLGIGGNWNACLRCAIKSGAPYIQFLFQDDVWNANYLKNAIDALEKNPSAGIAAVWHHYEYEGDIPTRALYENVLKIRKQVFKHGLNNGKTLLGTWIERELHPNLIGEPSFVMLRSETAKHIGFFDEAMPQFLDVEYWLRCLTHTDVAFVPEDSGAFRVHPGGASAKNFESGAGIYDRLACFERVIALLPAGPERDAAKLARKSALTDMVRKFLHRKKQGKGTPMWGSGKLMKFVLRHPVHFMNAVLNAYFT